MTIIRFSGFGEVSVKVGRSILDAAAKALVPVGSACGGARACSTCHVYVGKGAELLSAQTDEEGDILDKVFDVRSASRLACQARVVGEGIVEVEVTRESFEAYENEHPDERGKYTAAGVISYQSPPEPAP